MVAPAWPRGFADRALYLLLTAGGSGLSPVAPGTTGTMAAVLVGVALQMFWQGSTLAWILGGLAAGLLVVGCMTTAYVERVFQSKDPGAFVLDEVVGYLLALAVIAALQNEKGPTPAAHAACFVAFRFFDILKPPPVNRAEEFPGAVGIMMDDVVAGLYAVVVLWLLHSVDVL